MNEIILTPLAVDLLSLAGISFFAWRSWRKGFLVALSGFFALVFSLVLALVLYRPVTDFLVPFGMERQLAVPISLLAVFMAADTFLCWWCHRALHFLVVGRGYSRYFYWLTLPLSLIEGVLIVAAIVIGVSSMPLSIRERQSIIESRVAGRLMGWTMDLDRSFFSAFSEDGQDLVFYTVGDESAPGDSRPLGYVVDDAQVNVSYEAEIMGWVNDERADNSVEPLEFDPELLGIAHDHASDMLARGYFSHYSPEGKNVIDRAVSADVPFLVIAENLAIAGSVESAHEGLMNSPSHRSNILSPLYSRYAVAVMEAGRHGLVVVQVFAH